MTHRISMTNGAKIDGSKGSKLALVAQARRSGLVVARAWADGSVPLYRDRGEARGDNAGDRAVGLIRKQHNAEGA